MPREPWIKVKIGIRRSGKMAGLPNDSARLGYFYALVEAKVQRQMGVFDNRAHFSEVLGRFGRYTDDYLAQGLIEVAPDLCKDCKSRHRGARKGALVVHDYLREQRDPTNADRQAAYREAHADEDDSNAERNGDRNADHNDDVTLPDATAEPALESIEPTKGQPSRPRAGTRDRAGAGAREAQKPDRPQSSPVRNDDRNGESGPTVTGDSRARATTATATGTTKKKDVLGSPDVEYPVPDGREPTLSKSELQAWSTFGSEWDGVKAAWIGRGLRLPPTGGPIEGDDSTQRGVLFQVLDARPTDLVAWIREAPGKTSHDVIGHVLTRWHEIRAQVGADEDLEKAWGVQPTKSEAIETVGQIMARIAQG
jgi:hypothetical protein